MGNVSTVPAPAVWSVDGWGDWTVDAVWDDGDLRLDITSGHGRPFACVDVAG